ncbi:ferric uptake regulator, Fur family [Methylobacillus flagellatus KT]|uniref:Ferric uptake regulator, Fur family n=2 Tax=Methylobacillus flagellatus TaxID=405 RepID=Q1H1Y6_METFK|nr:ferric uptake regulator, Fur family [Methylobacillus flagellatus KT]
MIVCNLAPMHNAERMIHEIGQRPTSSRVAVLNVLMESEFPLTHHEILQTLTQEAPFDRVTLYRVLDWLVECNLVHPIMGDDRARRFQLTQRNAKHHHAHFECSSCGKIFCLDEVKPRIPNSVPSHFTVESVELNIKGQCDHCNSVAN